MIVNYDYHPLFRKYFYYYQLSAVEFDTYLESKAYIDEHNLVYEEPEYGE